MSEIPLCEPQGETASGQKAASPSSSLLSSQVLEGPGLPSPPHDIMFCQLEIFLVLCWSTYDTIGQGSQPVNI